ncbi:hypothetical protein H9X57_16880 [Flavobacterium piscinae]|uniref:Uncharacterized protein n=1 Tax=Flavobacterium piscinae TaxID=2506424 RepID=A0A4Q1KN80_9FLAO|nr:hypothetical protein [Flavobacterium piscinae]MBC8884439.1 hypothetical protein [Flavobacterium piscinae]RXR30669.1 hypothetical protein EQG68_11465 [Flavobacterium piscinae]
MSTTFEVIPIETTEITFRQVVELSEKRINSFLKQNNIDKDISLNINLHENSEKYVKEINLDSAFEWQEDEYVWFKIDGVAGGTDSYCEVLKDLSEPNDPWWRLDDFKANNSTIEDFDSKIEKVKNLNRYWTLRRSMGQTGLINLSYGLISASIAELTNGFIWTDDGAWDYKKFPAEPVEFYKWYFNPDVEENEEFSDWAKRCLNGIKEEIIAVNNGSNAMADESVNDTINNKTNFWSKLKSWWS